MKTNSKKLILLSALMLAVGACKTETKKTAGGGGSGGGSGGGASGGQVDPAAFNTVKSLECDNGNLFLSLDLQKNNNGESKLVVLESLTDASDGWNEWSGELPYNNFAAVGTKNGTTSGNIYRKVQDDGIVIAYVAEKEVVEGEIYAYIKFDPAEGEGEFYFQDFICEEASDSDTNEVVAEEEAPEVAEAEETPTEDTSSESEEKTEEGVDTVESTPADDSGDDSDSEESSGDTANNEENN